eukprot:TRINITY_DN75722_c0_g1_i1.p1 TRINITY_DN75722_c0_g1~~TRINITY_DN75722_c0_g1_i1.p1  ORF type:complete len:192 (+),score=7.59 TRINITY_DN75722_c0_g1_i1:79-576(+)
MATMADDHCSAGYHKVTGSIFNISYTGENNTSAWHTNPVVGVSCLSYALFGALMFIPRSQWFLTSFTCLTSAGSFWADYMHIEEPLHVAHRVDRVIAFSYTGMMVYSSLFIVRLRFVYCAIVLAVAVALFWMSRQAKTRDQWALLHTTWHLVPPCLLLVPDLIQI